jgi:PAS domain S-box-containing protein
MKAGEPPKTDHHRKALPGLYGIAMRTVDAASDEVFWLDDEGRFVYVNENACLSSGYRRDELLSMKVFDVDPDFSLDRWHDFLDVLRRRSVLRLQSRRFTKDGRVFPVEIRCFSAEQNGRPYVVAFSQDVSAREMIHSATNRGEFVLDSVKGMVSLINRSYVYEFVNRAFCYAHRKEKKEVVGRTVGDVWGHHTFEATIRPILDQCFTGAEVHNEAWMSFATNGPRFCEAVFSPYRDNGGEPTHAIVLTYDMTERKRYEEELRKYQEQLESLVRERTQQLEETNRLLEDELRERMRAEDALREQRDRFQILAENTSSGIMMIATDGAITYLNPKFTDMTGYGMDDVPTGHHWFQAAYPDPHYRRQVIGTWKNDLDEYVRTTGTGERKAWTFVVTCKDGQQRTVNFRPVRLATGEHVVTMEDITERDRAQQMLLHSHRELERLNRLKTKAVDHISHELKTPLSVIKGNLRLLNRRIAESLDERSLASLDTVERHLDRLFRISHQADEIFRTTQEIEVASILDDLDKLWRKVSDLAEVPSDIWNHWYLLSEWLSSYLSRSTVSFRLIDIEPVLSALMNHTRTHISHRRLSVGFRCLPGLYLFTDAGLLRGIVESPLKNAVENTPDGGRIDVSAVQENGAVRITIGDSGIGITPDNLGHLLDGFFHAGATQRYTSKMPYDFGAGGKAMELLRLKIFSKRFGFEIAIDSQRCPHLPTDDATCPGAIGRCPHCMDTNDCIDTGGTTVTLSFPV